MSAWTDHVARWRDCTDCPLCQQRDRICLARGSIPCDLLFVGEAPGASEDAIGVPFIGPAGRLLDEIITRSLPWTDKPLVRHALTNLVACFPAEAKARGDNEPEHDEILACRSRLVEFVNIARPRLIVCVGSLATQYVPREPDMRYVDIVHPAAVLRMPLAQQQMAVQKSVVVLRNAVEDMLGSGSKNFTQWGNDDASSKTSAQQLRAAYTNDDIPF